MTPECCELLVPRGLNKHEGSGKNVDSHIFTYGNPLNNPDVCFEFAQDFCVKLRSGDSLEIEFMRFKILVMVQHLPSPLATSGRTKSRYVNHLNSMNHKLSWKVKTFKTSRPGEDVVIPR